MNCHCHVIINMQTTRFSANGGKKVENDNNVCMSSVCDTQPHAMYRDKKGMIMFACLLGLCTWSGLVWFGLVWLGFTCRQTHKKKLNVNNYNIIDLLMTVFVLFYIILYDPDVFSYNLNIHRKGT